MVHSTHTPAPCGTAVTQEKTDRELNHDAQADPRNTGTTLIHGKSRTGREQNREVEDGQGEQVGKH